MTRFELWTDWNKHCLNHPVYKFLVLIGLAHSPSFKSYSDVLETFVKHDICDYSIRDEKVKKNSDINWGWYIVYLMMVVVNAVMCSVHGFGVLTWQYWVWLTAIILSFTSGSEYRKGG